MYCNSYDVGEEQWILERPSVAEMKRQYEEMVARLSMGAPLPTRSTNKEKIMYLRRKKLQDQVPTQDKRPKVFSRFSLSIPLSLNLTEAEEEDEEEKQDAIDKATNTKRIESVEEWWGAFHSHNSSFKYHINIGSLSIGDTAIMELSSKLLPLTLQMTSPPVVTHLDISWNDIYEDGMVPFSGVLERLCISEIRMDGNQMGTGGLEAMLKSLCRPQPKKTGGSFNRSLNSSNGTSTPVGSPSLLRKAGANIPPISLSLRETNIGDDSCPSLATYLKPLPDNKILNLVQLDLTNTYIFDGITAITVALQNNTTLTTLVLNSNMIGDQGAFAIGELLLTNQTLNRLEIRNCDIGPTGTTHLCEGLQGHKGLKDFEGVKFMIDVGLNPWEFPGELQLLQTALAKPDMIINWREGDWEPSDDEELTTLIRTFGETKVMEKLMEGKGYLPLASPTQLLSSPLIATYAPVHIATIVENLSTIKPDTESAIALVNVVVQLLTVHGRANFKSWMTVLPPILHHLNSWMDPQFISQAKMRRQLEVLTVDLLSALGHINQQIIEDIVVRSNIVSHCLDNFLAYPNHNVYHFRMTKLIEEICSNTICGTLRQCTLNVITGEFFNRLLDVIKQQSTLSVKARNGSLSAAVMLARVIEPHLETRTALPMRKLLKQLEDEQKGCLVEPPPARSSVKLVLKKDSDI